MDSLLTDALLEGVPREQSKPTMWHRFCFEPYMMSFDRLRARGLGLRVGILLAGTTLTLHTENAFGQAQAHLEGGRDAEAARLLRSHATEPYEIDVPGVSIRAGGSMTAVNAPLAAVRAIVTDYGHYQDIVPGFQRCRVVAKGPEGTDVYLAAPILHGAATLWSITRFSPPVPDGGGERIDARRKGDANVEDFRATWRLYPIDESHTLLKLEIVMVPVLPLPHSMLTAHFVQAASSAIRACRDRAETRPIADNDPNDP